MRSQIFQTVMIVVLVMVASFSFALENNQALVTEYESSYNAPKPVETVKPERVFYSPSREVEGYVTVEMLVNEEGNVEEAKVLYRTSKMAVENAIDAVSEWKFEPATLDGVPVKATVAYNLAFGLNLDSYEDNSYAQKIVFDSDTFALK